MYLCRTNEELKLEHEKLINTVKFLLSMGADIEAVSQKTGLSVDEFKQLKIVMAGTICKKSF